MTPQAVIDEARIACNDPTPSPRYSDAVLLGYFNDFLKELARRKKELFHRFEEITLVDGELQSVSKSTTNGLVDVLRNDKSEHLRRVLRADIEFQKPRWRKSLTAKKPINWAYATAGNEFDFLVYPKAVSGDKLQVIIAGVPAEVLIGSLAVDLPYLSSNYRAAGAAYVAGRAIAINTSSVDVEKGLRLVDAGLKMI